MRLVTADVAIDEYLIALFSEQSRPGHFLNFTGFDSFQQYNMFLFL